MIGKQIIEQIARDSFVSCGSADWDSLMQKKHWNIAFLGGSVTQGYIARHVQPKAYPQMFSEIAAEQGREPEVTVCAEPGMFTMQCNMLLDTAVLPKQPDLVFVEFAINEMLQPPNVKSYESLLRRLMKAKKPPVICVIILRSANNYSCESYMQEIAEYYGLACVNVRRGLNAAIDAGLLTFADYADKESHPFEDGHALIAACLAEMLRRGGEQHGYTEKPLPEPWLEAAYEHLHFDAPAALPTCGAEIVPLERAFFRSAVHLTAQNPHWEMTLNSDVAVLLYEMHQLPNYGSCKLMIDGKPHHEAVIHTNSMYGWGNSSFTHLWVSEQPETHKISLELIEGEFFLLGVAYNANPGAES